MSDPTTTSARNRERRGANILSTILFIAALIFASGAVYLYLNQDEQSEGPPRPNATPGLNQFATVIDGLRNAGLSAKPGRYTAQANQLDQPGQIIEVDGVNLVVFLYPDANGDAAIAAREQDAEDLDPATLNVTSTESERPLSEGNDLHIYQGSNVTAILIGGDQELQDNVKQVIENLP